MSTSNPTAVGAVREGPSSGHRIQLLAAIGPIPGLLVALRRVLMASASSFFVEDLQVLLSDTGVRVLLTHPRTLQRYQAVFRPFVLCPTLPQLQVFIEEAVENYVLGEDDEDIVMDLVESDQDTLQVREVSKYKR
jgi:hypothetical protein